MENKVLGINDVDVTGHQVVYTCYGLGSCIGLFVTDRALKISGGAHIALPDSLPAGGFPGASNLIQKLLISFSDRGSNLKSLRAKLTGGSSMFNYQQNIGKQNAQAVLSHLMHHKIFIAASDVGGTISRTARYYSATGDLIITTSDHKKYTI